MNHFQSLQTNQKNQLNSKKLEVRTPLPNTQAAVIIHFANASLEINNGATQQTVEAVLLALKNLC